MNRHLWAGISIGILAVTLTRVALAAVVQAILRNADMDARTWTDDDDDLPQLARDLNGQQP